MKKHVKATPISAEENLRNEISKVNRTQIDNKLNKVIDYSAQLHTMNIWNGNRGEEHSCQELYSHEGTQIQSTLKK